MMSLRRLVPLCTLQLLLGASLLLASCDSEEPSAVQYVLSIPASLASGDTARACVNILDSKENLDLKLVINYNGQNTSIIKQDVPPPTYFQCAEFLVPKVPEAVPVAVIFSAIGKTTEMLERKSVVITPAKTNCVVQMDKPIYKPGQKVRCRVVCLDSQLKAFNEKFPAIYLQEPSRMRIAQWQQKETVRGIYQLEFQLISDAPPGSYAFQIERESGSTISQWFKVEEYVKPRWSMKVDAPNTISILNEDFHFNISAHYTYGEPVPGIVTAIYCKEPGLYGRRRNCLREKGDACSNVTGVLGPDGIYSGEIALDGLFVPSTGSSIRFDFIVSETATGIQNKESHYVWVTSQPARINFIYDEMNQYFKRGLDYVVAGTLTNERDQPMPNEDIEVQLDGSVVATVKTDSDGKIHHRIDTHDMLSPNFTVKISYTNSAQCYYAEWRDTDYPTTEYTAYRFYSRSASFLQAERLHKELTCGQEYNIDVDYILNPSAVRGGAKKVTIYYLVLSKSKIVHSGQKDIDLSSSKNGSISIALPVTADMAPNARLLIYSPLNKELITETLDLNIEKCFKNQVSMAFGEEKGIPGADVEVKISGDPESICGIKVMDYSLVLLNSYESFSADTIFNLIRTWFFGYNVAGFDLADPDPPCEDPNKQVFYQGNYYLPTSSNSERDSYQNLKELGLIVGTGLQTRKPVVCDNNPPEQIHRPVSIGLAKAAPEAMSFSKAADVGYSGGGAAAVETVRSDFSETMMWRLVSLDGQGQVSVTDKAPDSITKWQGSAFCLSDKGGFGMSRYPANYTTSLPFFVELTLPYSIIRGETLLLRGVVHNNLDYCVKMQVTLQPSNAFTAKLKEGAQENVCLCSKKQAVYTWEVQANKLEEIGFTATAETTFIGQSCDGPNDSSQPPRKDTVIQTLIVEAEGIKQVMTLSDLVFVKNTKSILPVKIAPPNSVVADSISASIVAVGDIFGLPLKNLKDLVQKPYGCGEQNLGRMAVLAPIMNYLNITDQLTEDILKKGKGFMTEGYYRQLQYLQGSAYRIFPNSGLSPNSWLTVAAFKAFEEAKEYIYIDPKLQQQTLLWLENTQRLDNGCFRPQGKPFMRQDVDYDLYFTAYAAVALLESKYSLGMTLLDGAMECLKNASTTDQKTAVEAVMFYAFSLAKLSEHRDLLQQRLMKKAVVEGGTMHWQRENMPTARPVPFFLPVFSPAEVTMTSYVLKSFTALPSRSEEDMANIAKTSLWLSRQMNPNGGFGSTTDTVLAVQALASVAEIMYTPNSQQAVSVIRNNAEIAKFDLNPNNRLLVQQEPLPEANGDYIVEVQGNGWCQVQTVVGYNIPIPKEDSAFSLALSSESNSCINGVTLTFNISGTVSYHGSQKASNMAIVKIRMLSGYTPDYWSLQQLVENKIISKHEDNQRGEVILYIDSVSAEKIHFMFRVWMDKTVLNVKQSAGMVYDYYAPEENGYASYGHPCAEVKQ